MLKVASKSHYYKWTTYRRILLDQLQEKHKYLYKGIILDIGGRDRGGFIKPKDKVEKWIFADINVEYNPDIVLDITNMTQISSNSIDVINAMELFEHVEDISSGLKECYRVLKKNGVLLISTPFLYHIHTDPHDFQRWTNTKWKNELTKLGFKIEKIIIMSRYFTVLGDMLKSLIKSFLKIFKYLGFLLFRILDRIVRLDNTFFIKKMFNYTVFMADTS
ncbi:hypothetical protein ES706_05656 [subsurface metagenome]